MIWFPRFMREIKREIRCKSGAIPVAVKEGALRMVRQWFDKLTMTTVVTLSLPKGCRRATTKPN
jgi:hypothetical protein